MNTAHHTISDELAEIELHDQWAEDTNPESVDVYAVVSGHNAVENRFLVHAAKRKFGSLSGLNVLDVGCGLGESSVYFAMEGATVTATDLSPGMVDFCSRLASYHEVAENVTCRVANADQMTVEECQYDIVYCANLLHHIPDMDSFLSYVAGSLKPGGLFLSFDPILGNPAIALYRLLARNVRSVDERPLRVRTVRRFRQYFRTVQHREFWFFAQAVFLKYFFWDRLNPGKVRYWKRIYKPCGRAGQFSMRCLHALDRLPLSLPLLRSWAWNMAIVAERH